MFKSKIFIAILILLIAGAIVYFDKQKQAPEKEIKNFSDCVAAGNPVMESYPRQCSVQNGGVFVEEIKTNNQINEDVILVTKPSAGASVSSPVEIEGQARGFWFFEASFPIEIQDKNGQVLGTGIAQAQSDWMTENFVPFKIGRASCRERVLTSV
jgi:hypothetical protein